MFLKLDDLKQDYVIHLTAKRKLLFHGKWVPATQLRNQRKGKIKTPLMYKGKRHDAYLSHVKIHGSSDWELDTILQEKGNCYLYEKMGYHQTGNMEMINDKLTLVFYKKD